MLVSLAFLGSRIYWLLLLAALPVCLGMLFLLGLDTRLDWTVQNPGPFVMLVCIMPILEEIVFRGLIQERLSQLLGFASLARISVANLVTSLLFVCFHFIAHAPSWALLVLIPSLVFGYSKEKFDSLLAPVLLHITYNAVYFVIFGQSNGRL